MKLFIWQDADPVSNNYHSDGGLLVIADTLDRARKMITTETSGMGDEGPCTALTVEPDSTRECEGPEMIRTFPNAGCC